MAKRSLADLAEQFKSKTTEGATNASWKLFFPFWKADMDTVSVVRFLPDLDDKNPLGFLVENHSHELVINGKKQTVPCLRMYDEDCPICALSQKYYDKKDPEHNETLGKKYYRKRSYIGQVLVLETPIEHDQEQLVKLIEFGPAIFKNIQAAFQSGDLEEVPYELQGGYNFRIKKSKSGEYASYTTSSFAPKQTDVSADVVERLELFNLKDHRTAHMSRDVLEAMLIADQTGSAYGDAGGSEQSQGLSLNRKAAAPKADADAPAPAAAPAEAPAKAGGSSMIEELRRRAAAQRAAQETA